MNSESLWVVESRTDKCVFEGVYSSHGRFRVLVTLIHKPMKGLQKNAFEDLASRFAASEWILE